MPDFNTKHLYITFDRALLSPAHPDANDPVKGPVLSQLRALAAYAVGSAAANTAKGKQVEYKISHDAIDLATIQFLVVTVPAAGYSVVVENCFAAVELTSAQMSDTIPVGVRDSIRLDDQDKPRSWQAFVDTLVSSNYVEALDNSKRIVYLPGNPYSDNAELAALIGAGLAVLMQEEVNVLLVPGGDYAAESQS